MTSLVETGVYIAIFAVLLGSVAASFAGNKAYAIRASVQSFGALLDEARAVAQTSGSGATLAIASASGGFTATLYPYRPLPDADTSAKAVLTITGTVAVTPIAIFVSSSGTAAAASWSIGDGTLSSEPSCAQPIALTFSDGMRNETHTISCATAQLQ